MQRVALLSHVKASSVPPTIRSSGARRIPWQGGKISSNKEEALQKFYQRKLQAGDHLTAQQIQATQASCTSRPPNERRNPKKLHATHRPHAKVSAGGNHTVLKTGRVLGPKLSASTSKQPTKKAMKQQIARQPQRPAKTVVKMAPTRAAVTSSTPIALEEKLGLPLDALVGNPSKLKRSNNSVKRR
ncbi:hypothetical protein BBJ28_00017835 [Nothophytophthora sp. Chile5]|nr:hypothetical protein BBJ28_00017835 [Nothophytophthora sp. Chile5]